MKTTPIDAAFAAAGLALAAIACSTSQNDAADAGASLSDDASASPPSADDPGATAEGGSTRDGGAADASASGADATAPDGALPPRGQNCAAYAKAAPVNGAREYVVDVGRGDDASDGSAGAPLKTVQRAATLAREGDVVTIRAGTYQELVYVQNSGSAHAPIVFQADACGAAVFTGASGFYPQVVGSPTIQDVCTSHAPGQHDITLSGLTFKDTQDSAVGSYSTVILPVDNWRITNVLVDGASDIAINARGVGVVIEQSTFMHGGSHSLVGCGGNTIVRNVINANNVTSQKAAADCGNSCSVKFLFTDHMLVDNIESYGNNGPGWWFDTDNFNFTVQNSYFHDNAGHGVFDEISDGPGLIQNNTFANNGIDIGLGESSNVTIAHNTMTGGSGTPIGLRTMTNRCEVQNGSACSKYYWLQNLTIRDNKVKGWTGCLIADPAYSADPAWASPPFQKLGIQMDYNTYWPGASGCWLSWQNEPSVSSLAGLQSTLGIEGHGSQASF